MKTKLLFLLAMVSLIACNPNAPEKGSKNPITSQYNIVYKGNSPYLDWFFSDQEAFMSISCLIHPQDREQKHLERVRRAEDNTITLEDGTKILLHDDYKLEDKGDSTTLNLTRTASVISESSNGPKRIKANYDFSGSYNYSYSIHTMEPMYIIKPAICDTNPIPECYYDNFIVQWPGDLANINDNGVVVVAEWHGVTMYEPSQDVFVANVDIVEDSGQAVLNPDLFDNIPNEALVTLWLIRGTAITIHAETANGETEILLRDALNGPPEFFEELVSSNPDILLNLQPFMLGSGAVTAFSFFLIRDL